MLNEWAIPVPLSERTMDMSNSVLFPNALRRFRMMMKVEYWPQDEGGELVVPPNQKPLLNTFEGCNESEFMGIPYRVDTSLDPHTVEFREKGGKVLGRIVNIGEPHA